MRRPNKKEEYLGVFLIVFMVLGLFLMVPFAITIKVITIIVLVLGIIVFIVAFVYFIIAVGNTLDVHGRVVAPPTVELTFAFDVNKEKTFHAALSKIRTIAKDAPMKDYELNKVEIYRLATEALEFKRLKIND